ncbi:MAG: MATE family efflux transporter [Pirellulaceae bacterium]|nr:MAG: MATE family efflux transporter [Pirellulaceae bacterium]
MEANLLRKRVSSRGLLRGWWRASGGVPEVLHVAWPLIISSLSWTVMTFVDRIFLMWWSTDALAAAYPASLIWWTALCLPLGVCSYVITFAAQYEGAGKAGRVGACVWQGIWSALFTGPLLVAMVPLVDRLLTLVGHDEAIHRLEMSYLGILMWAAPLMLLAAPISSYFSGTRRTRVVMVVDSTCTLLNVVLDYLWIFGKAGFGAAGIRGAAWATVVALAVRAAWYFLLLLRRAEEERYATYSFWLDPSLLGRLWYYGVPNGLQLFIEVLAYTAFVLFVGKLGTHPLAATNVALNVSSFAFMPVYGMGQAATILVGQYLGKNRPQRAARSAWSAAWLAVVYMGAISTLYVVVPDWFLFGYFLHNDQASAELRLMCIYLLRFVAAYNLFDAVNIVFSYAIKGAGDTYFVFLTTIMMTLILVGSTWALVYYVEVGIYECWWLLTIWTCLLGILYAARFLSGVWMRMRVIELQHPGTA